MGHILSPERPPQILFLLQKVLLSNISNILSLFFWNTLCNQYANNYPTSIDCHSLLAIYPFSTTVSIFVPIPKKWLCAATFFIFFESCNIITNMFARAPRMLQNANHIFTIMSHHWSHFLNYSPALCSQSEILQKCIRFGRHYESLKLYSSFWEPAIVLFSLQIYKWRFFLFKLRYKFIFEWT